MIKIIGVRFRHAGKMYYFNPGDLTVHYNDQVIVQTARGPEIGTVLIPPMLLEEEKIKQPLRDVIRAATKDDIRKDQEN